ncbi:DNA polymerase III subunit alpha [Enterobacteriaceae endosymbiont of Plateumaris consimilis]|uniref:DNA polymerase III subunit alpha n=1 Tax=Enterobacteriaceae endosymbiont of Plateumaris consimilis TaxID=2675794 RepID=UPI0014492917|nr:DNA polymerase III subunit alpha [Enterobacteriaceae endosymbiont of Plateumaris consimilis]QJC28636.1 DNA polymerase III subunit alpha [Enterobacteriaceae endosymbiont of Plateumaris consimilis]
MNKKNFIHLHVHSDYSMKDGLAKIEHLVQRTVEFNMPALAITDITNIFGLIKFYKKAHSSGIKAIIGSEFIVKNCINLHNYFTTITILAKNNIGYHNLKLLISDAYKDGYDNMIGPFITYKMLVKYNKGLIILSGGVKGDIGKNILSKNIFLVKKIINFYKKYFPNNFYLELTRTNRINEEKYIYLILNIANDFNLPVVATNDVCFLNKKDFLAHEIRVSINKGYTLNQFKKKSNYSSEQFFRSSKEMNELFYDIPESLENSIEIAKRCNVFLTLGKHFLPKFRNCVNNKDLLIKKAKIGLINRLKTLFPDNKIRHFKKNIYKKRLLKELDVINQMGFPSYFLIVMEFVQWSKDNYIPIGPARGSGAGSLVAYCLNITNIDPIKFDLIFERFLNPERISLPDFDIDFCMEKRDLVIEHVKNIYGYEKVSQIITFGTMTAKAVIRDVGRVLGYPYDFVNRISKLIPLDIGMSLKKAFIINKKLSNLYKSDNNVKDLVNTSLKLEGTIRNVGKHAGGVVIAPSKITKFTPIYCDSEGENIVTQFDKNDIEDIGLVKFDFLGLRTLTVIDHTLKIINKQNIKENKILIDINSINLNDKKVYSFLRTANTTAIFQLESKGIKDLIKRLKPDNFEDIISLLALFRPGPLQSGMVENFINRKHGKEIISYPNIKWQHKKLKSVLKSTYGIILYQEQVMKIAQVLAGYSLGKADILRRVISKKQHKEMLKQRSNFLKGSKKLNINTDLSMKIFDFLENFAAYGFNKSHSVGYALISYQTLWLKVYYPAAFMAAVLTSEMDNIKKIVNLVNECWNLKINLLPPNINTSIYEFHVNEKGNIIYGFGAIKGIGKYQAKHILNTREKYGFYKSIVNLCINTNFKKINKGIIEKLITSGAMDCFKYNRGILFNKLNENIRIARQYLKIKKSGQIDMFSLISKKQNIIDDLDFIWSNKEKFLQEKNTLGFYLSGHPFIEYFKEINFFYKINNIKNIKFFFDKNNLNFKIAGVISNIHYIYNMKKNKIVAFDIDDHTEMIEVNLTLDVFNKFSFLIKLENILIIKGFLFFDYFTKKIKFQGNNIIDIENFHKKHIYSISILIQDKLIFSNKKFFNILKNFLLENINVKGIPIYFYYKNNSIEIYHNQTYKILINEILLNKLKYILEQNKLQLKLNFNK